MCACINVFIWVYVCVCVCVCVCVGLCSYEDPEKALREMARVCKTEQQGGRILLLEHGRSWLWPVNVLLDRSVITKLYITLSHYRLYHTPCLTLSFFLSLWPVNVLLDRLGNYK
jgi:ubiquinone/menaquinone biosynthesis C-methylase UbiE